MTAPDAARDLLLAALRATPRRHRLPPLPADADAARAAGPEAAIAFALEAARRDPQQAAPLEVPFTGAMADLVHKALAQDSEFQARVLRSGDAQIRRYATLAQDEAADRRTLRARVNAFAHPGKLRTVADVAQRDALLALHTAAMAGDWDALHALAGTRAARPGALQEALATLAADPALQRLRDLRSLASTTAVQQYLAVRARQGPAAGSEDATRQGREAAQSGREAEAATVQAFEEIAAWLDGATGNPRHRAAGRLRPPAGFPGPADRAKDEWDAAILATGDEGAAQVLLLAEVKASPAAATQDLPRLRRGLQRLGHAEPAEAYPFASDRGVLRVAGASLRELRPRGQSLPAQVVYACPAAPQARPALLAPAARALLLAEDTSVQFALQVQAGARPPPAALAPLWQAVTGAPRLRAVLHQDADARRAREAIVHPRELLAALQALAPPPGCG